MLTLIRTVLGIGSGKLDWFRRAAERGDAYAQYRLGRMYAEGRGVPQDWRQAYFWFAVAASADRDLFRDDYARHRDAVARHLSPSETAAVRTLADQWTPTVGLRTSSPADELDESFVR